MQAVFDELRWRPTLACGCHNDLNPWNIIRVHGATAHGAFRTLDWESAGDNDPLFDLAGLALGLGWSRADALACLRAYCERRRISPSSPEARFDAAMCAYLIREHAWAAAQIATGADRAEIREQEESMRRAVLDWPAGAAG